MAPGKTKILNQQQAHVAPTLLIAGAVSLLALPSAVLAFTARFDFETTGLTENAISNQNLSKTPFGPRNPLAPRANAPVPLVDSLFRFTPAGLTNRRDRSVTVAVRVDSATARAIIVRGNFASKANGANQTAHIIPSLRVAPTAYNLGVVGGNHGFAQNSAVPSLSNELRKIEMPDLSSYKSGESGAGAGSTSRLAPRIALDERERAGRAPRTVDAYSTQTVDLGGSYRISRNLNVTAGVRYSRDGDRIRPENTGKTDSQSVFVGTQFRF